MLTTLCSQCSPALIKRTRPKGGKLLKAFAFAGTFAAAAGLSLPASATLMFNFIYGDPAGEGFNSAANGAERRAALEAAGANFATAFDDYNAVVDVVTFGNGSGNTLASAGSALVGPNPGFGNIEVTRNKIISNGAVDGTGTGPDALLRVNFDVNWEFDQDAPVNENFNNEFDWYSVIYHELMHVAGFISLVSTDANGQDASDVYGNNGPGGSYAAFDEFLTDGAGNPIFLGTDIDEALFEATVVAGNSADGNGLFFDSPDAGEPIGLFTPANYQPGSSVSHIDTQNPLYNRYLMLSAIAPGAGTRTLSPLELSIMRDIGYTNIQQIGRAVVQAVPAPASLLLVMLGLIGTGRRRG